MTITSVSHALVFTQDQQKAFREFIEQGFWVLDICQKNCAILGIKSRQMALYSDDWHMLNIALRFIRVLGDDFNAAQYQFQMENYHVHSLKALLYLAFKLKTWYKQLPREMQKSRAAYQQFIMAWDKVRPTIESFVDQVLGSDQNGVMIHRRYKSISVSLVSY